PSLAKLMASSPDAGVEMLAHALRHQELCVFGPAVAALGKSNLLLAERLPVGCTGVLLVRSSVPDMTLQDDERRLVFDVPETLDAIGEAPSVVRITNPMHIPTVGHEPRRYVLAEGEIGMAFDRHVIAVIDPTQVRELEMAGK